MKMKFSECYRILCEFEGLPYREMVHPWNQGDIAAIKEDFRTAVKKFRIDTGLTQNPPRRSNS
jgi:hypothetical protein